MLTFQVEPLEDCWLEADALRALHFEEVGQGRLFGWALDPDVERFFRVQEQGLLHIVTVRRDSVLRGYHVSMLERLLHYRTILASKGSSYFLHPAERTGRTPIRLFQAVEKTLIARGVQVHYDGTKLSHDHSRLFQALGYVPLEVLHVKKIGD